MEVGSSIHPAPQPLNRLCANCRHTDARTRTHLRTRSLFSHCVRLFFGFVSSLKRMIFLRCNLRKKHLR